MKTNSTFRSSMQMFFIVCGVISFVPLATIFLLKNDQFHDVKYQTFNDLDKQDPLTALKGFSSYNTATLDTLNHSLIEERMKFRREYAANKCKSLGLDKPGNDSLHRPNAREFLMNRKYHIIWCSIFKAASTSWMFNFNVLAGYSPTFLRNTEEVPFKLARAKYYRPSIQLLLKAQNDSITFMIARHPFERLLSAYRNKFETRNLKSYFFKLGFELSRRYGKATVDRIPTFSEVVSWLLNNIARGRQIDMHFQPATQFCTPCQIQFDVIMKFETLNEDQSYLIKKARLDDIIFPEKLNPSGDTKTADLSFDYYSQLTRSQLEGLYNYYRYDFEVFGYSAKAYFDVVKNVTDENT